ncbi:MAG: molybdopterin-guanine dinucleotide biosynthesis protein [Bradyrhizobium sp.]|nr:molybdopterin-guanine dinucleotide biosynthesis protein [Bradyrhizobium sp.]
MRSTALARIAVGVVVERRKARSPWADFLWRPVSVLVGSPSAAPWTLLDATAETALFYGGEAAIELHRTETTNYRNNLTSGAPALWVALRPVGSEPPYELLAVTADPAEGEAFTDAGSNLVEAVPMPPEVAEIIGRFIDAHHVERPFVKRSRQPAEPALARRGKGCAK